MTELPDMPYVLMVRIGNVYVRKGRYSVEQRAIRAAEEYSTAYVYDVRNRKIVYDSE